LNFEFLFILDFIYFSLTANSKRNVRTWNQSEFCQLHLYKENHMNSTPFVSVSHEIKKFKVGYTTRTYRITSSFDTDCCWRIKKNRKLLRVLRNNKKTNVFKRMGVRPPFVVKKCTKKQRKQKNNWKKPPLLLLYLWRAVKPKKTPYIILSTYLLTYSWTYNFKYKIPTHKKTLWTFLYYVRVFWGFFEPSTPLLAQGHFQYIK
jgi:hypothetical protein